MRSLLILALLFSVNAQASELSRWLEKHPDSNSAKCFDTANDSSLWATFELDALKYTAWTDVCFRLAEIERGLKQ